MAKCLFKSLHPSPKVFPLKSPCLSVKSHSTSTLVGYVALNPLCFLAFIGTYPFFVLRTVAGKSPCWWSPTRNFRQFLRTVPWKITCLKCVWKIPMFGHNFGAWNPLQPPYFLVKNRNPHVCCLKFHGNSPKMVVFPLERLLKCPSSPGELTGYRPKPRRSRSRRRNSQDSSMRSLRSSTWISLEKRVIHGENIIIIIYIYWLVVWTILKNMSSSMGRINPYMMENKKCSKPPISIYI